MGLSIDRIAFSDDEYRQAGIRLRENLDALAQLLERPGFGVGEPSLGAELEVSLVDDNFQAMPLNREVLADSLDPHLQLELDRFNLEYNLSPVMATDTPFSVEPRAHSAAAITPDVRAASALVESGSEPGSSPA